eukprot:scaffold97296_cov48-Phaeocystis_antarctica.AAC.2
MWSSSYLLRALDPEPGRISLSIYLGLKRPLLSPLTPQNRTTGYPHPTLSHVEDRQGPEDQDEEPSQVRSAAAAIGARHLTARTTPRACHDSRAPPGSPPGSHERARVPHRIMKDQEYTEKEILSQQNRIQSVPLPLAATAATAATATAAAATTVAAAAATEIASTGCPAQVKDNPEKDEHDVKKQEEVLAEYL